MLRSRVRIPLRAWMFVSCVCCALCRWGLGEVLITPLEESYWGEWITVCNLEATKRGGLGRRWVVGPQKKSKLNYTTIFLVREWEKPVKPMEERQFITVITIIIYGSFTKGWNIQKASVVDQARSRTVKYSYNELSLCAKTIGTFRTEESAIMVPHLISI